MNSTMASSSVGASEVVRAVSVFLGFSSGDQQALLGVIEDYFTSPYSADDLKDDDSCMPGSAHSL